VSDLARQLTERENDRADVGERVAAHLAAGKTWREAAATVGVSRDQARVCAETYVRAASGHIGWRLLAERDARHRVLYVDALLREQYALAQRTATP